jgi:hypothetical protein
MGLQVRQFTCPDAHAEADYAATREAAVHRSKGKADNCQASVSVKTRVKYATL